jgi:hypothetical protein
MRNTLQGLNPSGLPARRIIHRHKRWFTVYANEFGTS